MVVKLERRRYILIEFYSIRPQIQVFNKELRSIIARLQGQIGLAKSGLHVMEHLTQYFVIRCNHLYRDLAETALCLIQSTGIFKTVLVTGTLKTISDKLKDEIDLEIN